MIFYFSGNGNTKLAAEHLAEILGERLTRIDINTPMDFNLEAHRRVVWMFPVYSWGLPEIVRNFISGVKLSTSEELPHFMVATCGDDAGLTDRMWAKAVRKRGWRPVSAHTVIMPNTYVLLPGFDVDPQMLAADKLAASRERIATIAHAIKCRSRVDDVTRGKAAWLKTRVIYPAFMKWLTSPRPFHATEGCISCGKCSQVCPMKNITMVNGKPEWADRCTICLACYHHCPTHSVAYGKRTEGKGQYTAPTTYGDEEQS